MEMEIHPTDREGLTCWPPKVEDIPRELLQQVLDEARESLAAVLPDGYRLVDGQVRRTRADAPDRISIPGVNGLIELRNIPCGARPNSAPKNRNRPKTPSQEHPTSCQPQPTPPKPKPMDSG